LEEENIKQGDQQEKSFSVFASPEIWPTPFKTRQPLRNEVGKYPKILVVP
jgi:hypothetical protein